MERKVAPLPSLLSLAAGDGGPELPDRCCRCLRLASSPLSLPMLPRPVASRLPLRIGDSRPIFDACLLACTPQ